MNPLKLKHQLRTDIRGTANRSFWHPPLSCLVLLILVQWGSSGAHADSIPVNEKQGAMYGLLEVKSADGKIIAIADDVTSVRGNRIHSRLTFHFRDGSIDDEVTDFTEGSIFRLISDHHIQKGPAFREPLDLSINVPDKLVTWREVKNGREEVHTQHMEVPSDLANGMTSLIVENFPKNAPELKVSYLVVASKPRVVTLSTRPEGEEIFYVGGVARHAKRYRTHVEIGGLTGLIAPLIGRQPADIQMWVTAGEVATFLKMEGPLYEKGPTWTTELSAPGWPDPVRR
jgi:hypothetical protein